MACGMIRVAKQTQFLPEDENENNTKNQFIPNDVNICRVFCQSV